MPRFREPSSLVDSAMKSLAVCFSNHCLKLAAKGAFDDIKRGVQVMKNLIVSHAPRQLYVRFQTKLLDIIINIDAPRTHKHTILRIIRFARIVGFQGDFMCYSDPSDADRVMGVTAWTQTEYPMYRNFELFDLHDLLVFKMRIFCTDANLELIVQNCPKLEEIDVSYSRNVTDAGLRALVRCSNLRRVRYFGCSISLQGIDYLFSVNGKLQEMFAWSDMQGFDISDPSIHPAIESLKICNNGSDISTRYLNSVVEKFPNLTKLIIHTSGFTGDMYTLSELGKLSRLELLGDNAVDWMNLRALLSSVGDNIEELRVPITGQRNVDSVYELCGNVKYLVLTYDVSDSSMNRIVIPPFKNVTSFTWCNGGQGVLEFMGLPQLKSLDILRYDMALDIESLILDNERFPNLKQIRIDKRSDSNEIERLRQIVKTNNLDLEVDEVIY